MTVKILLFAGLRDRLGRHELARSIHARATVSDLVATLREEFPSLREAGPFSIAVNCEYVGVNHPLDDGDEVALIPPVSGG